MRLSTKGRYGVRILLDIALHQSDAPRMIREIAESQKMSQKYVSRLVLKLKKAGFIKSIRGVHGGYMIAKDPNDISVLEIVEAMEGPTSIVKCVKSPHKCKESDRCATRKIWAEVNENIREAFAKSKLSDIMKNGGALDVECIGVPKISTQCTK